MKQEIAELKTINNSKDETISKLQSKIDDNFLSYNIGISVKDYTVTELRKFKLKMKTIIDDLQDAMNCNETP